MSDQNFNQSIKHFCGGSNATGLFMEANYHGNNYTQPINSPSDPSLLFGTSLENIMFAKNYSQSSKVNGMNDDDVHHQYVDFIIRTALFHRELDKQTGIASGSTAVKQSLKDGIDAQFNEKIDNFDPTQTDNLLDAEGWVTVLNNITLRTLGFDKNTKYINYLNAAIILLSLSDTFGLPTNPLFPTEQNFSTKLAIIPSYVNRIRAVLGNTDTFKNQLKKLAGNCDDNGNSQSSYFGKLCLTSKFNGNNSASDILDKLTTDKRTALAEIMNLMVNSLIDYSAQIHRSAGGLVQMHTTYNAFTTDKQKIDYIKSLLQQINSDTQLLENLKETMLNSIFDYVRGRLYGNTKSANDFTTLNSNKHANALFENVFLNWGNLTPDARDFYRVHLHLFRKPIKVLGMATGTANEWEDLEDKLGDIDFLKSLDRNQTRVNLMKLTRGSENVLFGKTLPFLPVTGPKAVKNVWYTPAGSSVPISISSSNVTETFLQELYECVYLGKQCNFNGIRLNIPATFSVVENKIADFSIDDVLVIRNFIGSRKNNNPVQQNTSFESLFVHDMESQLVWRLDERGELYKIVNGQKVPYSKNEISIDNCVGSYLGGDKMQCSSLVRECLINGDKNSLNDCLGKMQQANMFNVAQSECKNVDPNVAIQILRTFGVGRVMVKDPELGDIYAPQPFEHWKDHTLIELRPALQQAILGDKKLCDYLQGVIAFVRANPAILNKNIPHGTQPSVVTQINDPYLIALKKKLYVNQFASQKSQQLFAAESLSRNINYPQIRMSSPAHLAVPFNNVTYGLNGIALSANRSLVGGATSAFEESYIRKIKRDGATSQLIATLMENLFEEMRNNGIPLNDNDRARINDGINKLAAGERSLSKYYSMLRALTDLALFFKASGCAPTDNEIKEISLDSIKNRADTLAYLYQNIGDVKNCINDGIEGHNSKCKELVNFYSTMVGSPNANTGLRVSPL